MDMNGQSVSSPAAIAESTLTSISLPLALSYAKCYQVDKLIYCMFVEFAFQFQFQAGRNKVCIEATQTTQG